MRILRLLEAKEEVPSPCFQQVPLSRIIAVEHRLQAFFCYNRGKKGKKETQ